MTPIITDHDGKTCPNCGDTMCGDKSNILPTWSDYHDNVVCWWCASHPHETDKYGSGATL